MQIEPTRGQVLAIETGQIMLVTCILSVTSEFFCTKPLTVNFQPLYLEFI